MNGPRPSPGDGTVAQWRRLVEHYTPDGALGRLVLGLVVGSVAVTALVYGLFAYTVGLVGLLFKVIATGAGLAGVSVALLALWPVYLSLIGNVESAADYPEGVGAPSVAPAGDDGDAYAALKRRYANGEISEAEFRERVDTLLEHDQDRTSAPRGRSTGSDPDRRADSDAVRETDRA